MADTAGARRSLQFGSAMFNFSRCRAVYVRVRVRVCACACSNGKPMNRDGRYCHQKAFCRFVSRLRTAEAKSPSMLCRCRPSTGALLSMRGEWLFVCLCVIDVRSAALEERRRISRAVQDRVRAAQVGSFRVGLWAGVLGLSLLLLLSVCVCVCVCCSCQTPMRKR